MRIESGVNPNCSEAVFRFHTEDTEVARKILQAFANEVAAAETARRLTPMGAGGIAKVLPAPSFFRRQP